MPKIRMTCIKCNYTCTWYQSYWHEVMEAYIEPGKYLCQWCCEEIKEKAVKNYLKKRKVKELCKKTKKKILV
jgi:hypothetical protein